MSLRYEVWRNELKQLKGKFGVAKQLWCALKKDSDRGGCFERRIGR
jgi:hypothetical protein